MPKSKGRQKQKRRSYVPPPPKKKRKPSPKWYGVVLLALMFIGVGIIVLNYMGLVPGSGGVAASKYLWVGLGFIAAGFLGSTRWR
ncbi:MAG: cell division protein CrgA [Actinomycetota bacterium]